MGEQSSFNVTLRDRTWEPRYSRPGVRSVRRKSPRALPGAMGSVGGVMARHGSRYRSGWETAWKRCEIKLVEARSAEDKRERNSARVSLGRSVMMAIVSEVGLLVVDGGWWVVEGEVEG